VIERQTRAGTLGLYDAAAGPCATCDRTDTPALIAIIATVVGGEHDGRRLETAICADCLAEALAIHFGRRHVQDGGDVDDLVIPPGP
jgi:hypothetical protein